MVYCSFLPRIWSRNCDEDSGKRPDEVVGSPINYIRKKKLRSFLMILCWSPQNYITILLLPSPSLNTPFTVNANNVLYGKDKMTFMCKKENKSVSDSMQMSLKNLPYMYWHRWWMKRSRAGSWAVHWWRRPRSAGTFLANGSACLSKESSRFSG